MKRSIPIEELELLAAQWSAWAKARLLEHHESPDTQTKENSFTAAGLLSAAEDLRTLIREITVG